MYMLLVALILGGDLQTDKDWYLSRKMHDIRVGRNLGPNYLAAKQHLESMDPQEQRAYIEAERIRSRQRLQAHRSFMGAQRMRIEQTQPKPLPPKIYRFNPYPQLYFGPHYKPYYAFPYYHSPFYYHYYQSPFSYHVIR